MIPEMGCALSALANRAAACAAAYHPPRQQHLPIPPTSSAPCWASSAGAAALIFGPRDWNDFARTDGALPQPRIPSGPFGVYHYEIASCVRQAPPDASCVRSTQYCPRQTFIEPTDEDICGCLDTNPIVAGNYMTGETAWWGNNICAAIRSRPPRIHPFAGSRKPGCDPVADRLLVNLVRHLPGEACLLRNSTPIPRPARDWLVRERVDGIRHWKVLGILQLGRCRP